MGGGARPPFIVLYAFTRPPASHSLLCSPTLSSPQAQRNYPGDSFILAFFGPTAANVFNTSGALPLQASLYRQMVAQALEKKGDIEQRRGKNHWGSITWCVFLLGVCLPRVTHFYPPPVSHTLYPPHPLSSPPSPPLPSPPLSQATERDLAHRGVGEYRVRHCGLHPWSSAGGEVEAPAPPPGVPPLPPSDWGVWRGWELLREE